VNEINRCLGNYGTTIFLDQYLRTHGAVDADMINLIRRMNEGSVNALIFWGVNPAYTWFDGQAFSEGLRKVGLTVSLSGSPDETSSLVQFICPDNHYMESWNDAEPKKDFFSLMQPVINPLFDTRQMTETLLRWSGSTINYYDFIRSYWSVHMLQRQKEFTDPVAFFDHTLQKGVFEPVNEINASASYIPSVRFQPVDLPLMNAENNDTEALVEVIVYEPVAVGEGRQANNPWLQELPDPIARICWDNYASVSVQQAKENNLANGDLIDLGGTTFPVHIQPGQAYGTISVAIGYGRRTCGPVGEDVGTDSWWLFSAENGNIINTRSLIK